MKTKAIVFMATMALLLAACRQLPAAPIAPAASNLATRKINVVATTGQVADAVRNVGRHRVSVRVLMRPGVDPHLYRPSAGDVDALGDADIIFYNGLELEGRMTDLFVKMSRAGKPTVPVAEGIPEDLLRESKELQGRYDPHVWFDVALWKYAVSNVADALAELDPSSKDLYQQNSAAYLRQLDELDAYIRAQAATVPESARVLITAHDAFGYFGQAYGFEVKGLQGISTAAEASPRDVRDLARFICERGIKAIFVESSAPRETIEAVQAAAKAAGCAVGIGAELFSDAMGNEGTPEGAYIGMLRYNIDAIVNALR
jgi:manganese/zinc/iron transport system substrate-binding protein